MVNLKFRSIFIHSLFRDIEITSKLVCLVLCNLNVLSVLDLLEMNTKRAPQDKLACIVKCSKCIFRIFSFL